MSTRCANRLCRQEFRCKSGPGRRQMYHSELCRRTAEREYRRTLQRLAHFENQVEQHRALAAAFGRGVTASEGGDDEVIDDLAEVHARGGHSMRALRDIESELSRLAVVRSAYRGRLKRVLYELDRLRFGTRSPNGSVETPPMPELFIDPQFQAMYDRVAEAASEPASRLNNERVNGADD